MYGPAFALEVCFENSSSNLMFELDLHHFSTEVALYGILL